ncbi:MAG: dTDP-4-dehydrorhamnose 3,5-epimerase [Candidatus Aquirickettsiella sp.]
MKIIATPLNDLFLIDPQTHKDERGFFLEAFQAERYQELLKKDIYFVQDNLSRSSKHVLRGLHYQLKQPQDKLITIVRGSVFDVAVDIRTQSATFGQWFGVILNDENHYQLFIPKGFAHGFCVLSELVDFHYKCTDYYNPEAEQGILWSDPNLAINWPVQTPIISSKDKNYAYLKNLPATLLF